MKGSCLENVRVPSQVQRINLGPTAAGGRAGSEGWAARGGWCRGGRGRAAAAQQLLQGAQDPASSLERRAQNTAQRCFALTQGSAYISGRGCWLGARRRAAPPPWSSVARLLLPKARRRPGAEASFDEGAFGEHLLLGPYCGRRGFAHALPQLTVLKRESELQAGFCSGHSALSAGSKLQSRVDTGFALLWAVASSCRREGFPRGS